MIKNKILPYVLVLLNILFVIYFAFWSFNGFMHFDDLGLTANLAHMSILEYTKYIYITQSGRFVSVLICAVIFKFVALTGVYRFFPFLFLLIGYALMGMSVKNLPFTNKKMVSLIAILLYNLYVFTAIDFPVFTWICALYYYLLAPSLLLFCIYLCKSSLNVWQWIMFALSGIFIAGGSEAFTPVALFVMFLIGLYYWRKNNWSIRETWSLPQVRRIVYTAVCILLLFAVVVVAPGNYVRMEQSVGEGFAHPVGVVGWVIAIAKCVSMFLYMSAFYAPYYLVLFFFCCYLGANQQNKLPLTKIQSILIISALFVAYLVVSAIPIAFVYNGFGIQRLYTHVTFVLVGYVGGLGFIAGINAPQLMKMSKVMAIALGTMLSGIVVLDLVNDVPVMRRFSKSVDDRVTLLTNLQKQGNRETVIVEPYAEMQVPDVKYIILKLVGKHNNPMSSLYYGADTDVNPNEYENHYKKVYGLDFDFVLPTE